MERWAKMAVSDNISSNLKVQQSNKWQGCKIVYF